MPHGSITVQELYKLTNSGSIDLIDVRTPAEFHEVHATVARNEPLESLNVQQAIEQRNSEDPLYVICLSGTRSGNACRKFCDAGFTNVISVEGGTRAWTDAGLPVVRGRKTISLERQVRICAGLIALGGSVAALATGNVYFAGIPAFIGAGLTFAGITDTCGMGMMLAKMPWNQVSRPSCSTS